MTSIFGNCGKMYGCPLGCTIYMKKQPGGGRWGCKNIDMERYREFGGVFHTFSLSLADEQIFSP